MTHSYKHTQGILVKAVVAGETAVRPGRRLDIWRSGLMAVKTSTTDKTLPYCSIAHSNDIRLAGTWKKIENVKINELCVRVGLSPAPYLLPVALTGRTQMLEPKQSVHSVPRLVLVGVT